MLIISGRGPIILISPFNTLINWGSSSKLYLRMYFPTFVTLGLFSEAVLNIKFSGTPFVQLYELWELEATGICLFFIERSLNILKVFPFNPLLGCLKKIGLPSSFIINMAKIKKSGDRINKAIKLKTISKVRLIKCWNILFDLSHFTSLRFSNLLIFLHSTFSICNAQ